MELFALTLLIIAALTHATWNAVAKSVTGNAVVFVWAYLTVATVALLPITSIFLLEQGWPTEAKFIYIPVVSGALHVAYLVTLQRAYARGDLGVVYPTARGVGPLLTMIVAISLLGERPKPTALAGALVLLAGILCVAAAAPRGGKWLSRGTLWGVATGATISLYTLWDNQAVTSWDLDIIPFFTLATTTQAAILTPFALRHLREQKARVTLRRHVWRVLAVAILWPAGYLLVLKVQETTPISIVAPVREMSVVFGALIGWVIYRERRPLQRTIGAIVVLAGILLLAQ